MKLPVIAVREEFLDVLSQSFRELRAQFDKFTEDGQSRRRRKDSLVTLSQ